MVELMAILVGMVTIFSVSLAVMHYLFGMFEKRIEHKIDSSLEKVEIRIDHLAEKMEVANNELVDARKRTDQLYQMHCELYQMHCDSQKEANQKFYDLLRQITPRTNP